MPAEREGERQTMKWLLLLAGLFAAAAGQGCCQGGGLFGHPGYGYYGSYPAAPVTAAPAAYPAYTTNPCQCQ